MRFSIFTRWPGRRTAVNAEFPSVRPSYEYDDKIHMFFRYGTGMLVDPVLVLVDLQNDFCNPEFISDEVDLEPIVSGVDSAEIFLSRYRETGRTPIFVRTTHDERSNSRLWAEKYAERNQTMPCRPGTKGAEFVPSLEVHSDDIIITKHRYSAFHETALDLYLSSNDISELLIGGVNTNVCVASTVFDAYNRDYDVTVLEDCTATTDSSQSKPALDNFDAHFGSVQSSTEIQLGPLD